MNLSIVIPVYNEEKSIGACLDSLLGQTLKPKEIIIIDDGSTDKTCKVVKKYPVKLLKQNHQGPGPARNLGVKKSRGDIIVFVDADMTFDKKFLEKLTLPIKKGKSKGTYNSREYVSNWENSWARSWNYNENNPGKSRLRPGEKEDSEDFRAILKSEFLKSGGFSAIGYTDSRTLVAKLGYRPQNAPGAISYHDNPNTLKEIFYQSKWIGKRETKLGFLGKLINLIRYSLPFSLCLGVYKTIKYQEIYFLPFKIIYDLSFSLGILQSIFTNNLNK